MSGRQIIIFLKNNHLVKDSRQKKNLGGGWMNESRTVYRKKQRAKINAYN